MTTPVTRKILNDAARRFDAASTPAEATLFYCKACGNTQTAADCDDLSCGRCGNSDWSPRTAAASKRSDRGAATARPWTQATHNLTLITGGGKALAEVLPNLPAPECQANAALIVQACNSFDQLKRACEIALNSPSIDEIARAALQAALDAASA